MSPMRPLIPDIMYNVDVHSHRICSVDFDDFECCSAFCLMFIFFILFTSFKLGSKFCTFHRRHSESCTVGSACGSVVGWIVYWHLV